MTINTATHTIQNSLYKTPTPICGACLGHAQEASDRVLKIRKQNVDCFFCKQLEGDGPEEVEDVKQFQIRVKNEGLLQAGCVEIIDDPEEFEACNDYTYYELTVEEMVSFTANQTKAAPTQVYYNRVAKNIRELGEKCG